MRSALSSSSKKEAAISDKEAALLGRLIDQRICGRLQELSLPRLGGLSASFGAFCQAATLGASLAGPLKSHLATLQFDGNAIGDGGAKQLADAARTGALRSITRLSLAGCSICNSALSSSWLLGSLSLSE